MLALIPVGWLSHRFGAVMAKASSLFTNLAAGAGRLLVVPMGVITTDNEHSVGWCWSYGWEKEQVERGRNVAWRGEIWSENGKKRKDWRWGEVSRRTERESKELKQKVERRRNDERVENSEKEMRQIRRQGSKNRSIKEARWGERGMRKNRE